MSHGSQKRVAVTGAGYLAFAFATFVFGGRAGAESIVPPRLLDGLAPPPVYPAELVGAAPVRARVLVELSIDAQGAVTAAQTVDVATDPAGADRRPFVAPAADYAHSLRFIPALRDDHPVAAKIRFEFAIVPEVAASQAVPPIGVAAPGAEQEPPSAPTTVALPEQQGGGDAASDAVAPTTGATGGIASDDSGARELPAASAPPTAADVPTIEAPPADTAATPSFHAHAHVAAGAGPEPPSAASDVEVELGALREVPRASAQDYLTLAPGVVLANHSGIGHAGGIFLRGFDAGEGQDLEVSVDGMPINEPSNAHAHGYADTQFVIPELVERVRVLEGPFDPRQGDFAVAGSAHYELGVHERGLRAQVGYGRFDEQRALLLWAPTGAGPGTFAAVDLRRGDGFGPNRAHASLSALARYADTSGPLRHSVLVGSHALDFDSAGVLRQAAYEARSLPCAKDETSQFFCVADPQQGGSASRHFVNATLAWHRPDRSYELQVFGMLRSLRMRENFTGDLLHPEGDGLDEGYQTGTLGLRSSYTLTPSLWGRRQRLELGLEGRHDRGETRVWRVRRDGAFAYDTVFDRDLALTHVAAYVRGDVSPLAWFHVLAGARLEGFGFQTVDLAGPDMDRVGPRLRTSERDAWGTAISPRGSLIVHATRELDWMASAGLGVRSSDAQALSEGEAAPFARVLSLETGPHAKLPLGADNTLDARAFAFGTRVENDLVFDAERGRNVPVGPSNRLGASASARTRFGRNHDTLLSVTWTEAYKSTREQGLFSRGARLPFVPRAVMRLDHASLFDLRLGSEALQLKAALGLGWIGPQPLPLATESEARWQLDLALRARVRFVELGVSVENVFDVRNHAAEFNYASHFDDGDAISMRSVRHFAAGPPRLWMFTLTLYVDDIPGAAEGEST